jgi:hypothetical protein
MVLHRLSRQFQRPLQATGPRRPKPIRIHQTPLPMYLR